MTTRKDVPRNGPARALWEADEDTPVTEIPALLEEVARWECVSCGEQRFTCPQRCRRCGCADFQKTVPADTVTGDA